MENSGEENRILKENGPSKTLCFTGHRVISKDDMDELARLLDEVIEKAIGDGFCVFLSGGALGFDTASAFRVLAAKAEFPDIKLILVLPCRNQSEKWKNQRDLLEYQMLKDNADDIIYTSEQYEKGCMHKRNRFMVDNSSRVISYLIKKRSGSAYTAKYAEKKGVECVSLADLMGK